MFPFLQSLLGSEHDAKEVIQETFLKCWLQRDALTSITNPGGWLHTVASNTAYSYLRSQARYELHLKKIPVLPDASDELQQGLDAKEVQSLIARAVEQLPTRRREVFQLSRGEGYSRREIAEQLGISENTVRNQLADAVAFIQEYVRAHSAVYIPAILVLLANQ